MSDARYPALTDALDELVAQMQQHALWATVQPDASALASKQPFCIDTLSFEQWLQFVMLPTFLNTITARQTLPMHCDIQSMADHVWSARYLEVQAAIKVIDRIISNGK